jgi:hypothetical protein
MEYAKYMFFYGYKRTSLDRVAPEELQQMVTPCWRVKLCLSMPRVERGISALLPFV